MLVGYNILFLPQLIVLELMSLMWPELKSQNILSLASVTAGWDHLLLNQLKGKKKNKELLHQFIS